MLDFKRKIGLYEISVILFFLIVPISSILIDIFAVKSPISFFLCLKWSCFSIIGLRLLSAGLKQIIAPNFTLKSIFGIEDERASKLVREIGFSNIAIGVVAILSLFVPTFCLPISICGAIYFLLCGLMHIKDRKIGEFFPLLTDLFASFILTVLILLVLLR